MEREMEIEKRQSLLSARLDLDVSEREQFVRFRREAEVEKWPPRA
jgi:hypothetical protein